MSQSPISQSPLPDSPISTASYLRQRAAEYRTLARRALASGIAREFYAMAHEYDEDAERLDARPRESRRTV